MKVRITFPNRAPETWEVEENRWGGSPDLICSRDGVRCEVEFRTRMLRNVFYARLTTTATATINGESFQVVVKAFGK